MTIDTDHLRRTARLLSSHSRNILTPAGVDAVIAACDHIDAQEAEIERLRKALSDIADLYDTDEGCRSLPEYIAARAALSGEST